MISLIVHAVLGVATTMMVVVCNRRVFARSAEGPLVSVLEGVYYAVAVISLLLGWYFNIRFVGQYSNGGNPIWGEEGSWAHYIRLMFTNWAADSAGQDYVIANVVLFPLWSIVDGRRRGIRVPWGFFVMSLFTSFGFAMAAYLATVERQRRFVQRAVAVSV